MNLKLSKRALVGVGVGVAHLVCAIVIYVLTAGANSDDAFLVLLGQGVSGLIFAPVGFAMRSRRGLGVAAVTPLGFAILPFVTGDTGVWVVLASFWTVASLIVLTAGMSASRY